MARLILDTGVLIAGVRGQVDMAALTEADDAALPTIAVAEYLTGTLRETDPERAADFKRTSAQRAFLDEVLQVLPLCDYDHTVAEHHAALLAHVQRTGGIRGAHDLVIAATARATNRIVLTTDKRAHFDELPEFDARVVAG